MPSVRSPEKIGGKIFNTTDKDIFFGRFTIRAGSFLIIDDDQVKQSRYAYNTLKTLLDSGKLAYEKKVVVPPAPVKPEPAEPETVKPEPVKPEPAVPVEVVEDHPEKKKKKKKKGGDK